MKANVDEGHLWRTGRICISGPGSLHAVCFYRKTVEKKEEIFLMTLKRTLLSKECTKKLQRWNTYMMIIFIWYCKNATEFEKNKFYVLWEFFFKILWPSQNIWTYFIPFWDSYVNYLLRVFEARTEIQKCYRWFLVQIETLKFAFGIKVQIFWEGHKILRNLHLTFVLCSASQK